MASLKFPSASVAKAEMVGAVAGADAASDGFNTGRGGAEIPAGGLALSWRLALLAPSGEGEKGGDIPGGVLRLGLADPTVLRIPVGMLRPGMLDPTVLPIPGEVIRPELADRAATPGEGEGEGEGESERGVGGDEAVGERPQIGEIPPG